MFGSRRKQGEDESRRLSSRMLLFALVVTLFVVVGGSSLVWGIYNSSFVPHTPSPSSAPSGTPLIVGVGRTPGGPDEWETYGKVFSRLQKDLGRPISVRYVLDGNDSAELLERGELDVALVSTRVYLKLARKDALTLIAAPVISGDAKDAAVLIVNSASPVNTLDELRGKELRVSNDSLSGGAFITWLLGRQGESPERFFSSVREADVQDTNLTLLAKGDIEATAVRRSALASWPAGTFRILAASPEFGMPPVVARKGLDAGTVAAIRRSLFRAAENGALPAGSVIKGFAPIDDTAFDFARELEMARDEAPTQDGDGE